MNILAFDTSTGWTIVALLKGESLKEETHFKPLEQHKILVPRIQAILEEQKLELEDINLLIVGIGPGSFTGTRVGVATAKAIALAKRIPLVGVTSLEALIYQASGKIKGGVVAPIQDARKNEVFTMVVDDVGNHLIPEVSCRIETLCFILNILGEKVHFIGNAMDLYLSNIKALLKVPYTIASKEENLIKGESLIGAGLGKYKEGKLVDAINLVPQYLRQSNAELKYDKSI